MSQSYKLSIATVKPRFIRTILSYGRFALSLGKKNPHIFSKFNPLNTNTPLIRTLSMLPQCPYQRGLPVLSQRNKRFRASSSRKLGSKKKILLSLKIYRAKIRLETLAKEAKICASHRTPFCIFTNLG